MARKPNYRFERKERERQKAEKKAARLAKRDLKKLEKNPDTEGVSPVLLDEEIKKNRD